MFRKLLTFDEAKEAINRLPLSTLGCEGVTLLKGFNRVLAVDVRASLDIPPFDRSTVDGYAVRASDTFGAEEKQPMQLKVCGVVNVGELPKIHVAKGEAAEIVTGAPIPDGADAVVRAEDTEREEVGLRVFSVVPKNEKVMKKGSDIRKG